MWTRRNLLRLTAAPLWWRVAKGADKEVFERIDSHIHIHRDAPAVIASLVESHWSGLSLVVCPAIGDEPTDLDSRLASTGEVSRSSGGRLAWASTFDARGFEAADFTERTIAQLRKSFDDRAIGVKIWKTIGMGIRARSGAFLLPDDPTLLPIYEAIAQADKTLVAHLAEPDGAWMPLNASNPELPYYSNNPKWHMHGRSEAPSKEAILTARDRVLARYPKLRVVGCHLGSDEDDLRRLALRLDRFPNFAVDTAARIRYFARGDRDQAREFLTRYQDRILYATDFELRDTAPELGAKQLLDIHERDWKFFSTDAKMEYNGRPTQGLALPDPVLHKIFQANARRWLPGIGV